MKGTRPISAVKLFFLAFFTMAFQLFQAQTVFVDPVNGDDANNGASWSSAKKTIMNAIWNAPGVSYDGNVSDIFVYVKEGTAVETPNTYESPDGLSFSSAGVTGLYTTVPAGKNITVQGSINSSASGTATGTCGYVPPVVSLDHVTQVTLSDTNQQGLFRLFGNSGDITLKGLYCFNFDGALENFGALVGARDAYADQTITIQDCVVDNVRVGVSMPAIRLTDSGVKNNTINLMNSIFRNNSEGVIREYSTGGNNTWNLTDNKFDDNLQYGTFSVIDLNNDGLRSTFNATGNTFCNNTRSAANLPNGIVKIDGDGWNVTFTDNIFYNNFTGDQGGAIYLQNADVVMTGNEFSKNKTNDDGGALYIKGCTLQSSGNTYTENFADVAGEGGAIYIATPVGTTRTPAYTFDNDTFYKNNTTVEGAAATGDGGAIYVEGLGENIAISNSFFGDNTADNGGAIKSFADISIVNTIFHANKADDGLGGGLGGAIDSRNSGTDISSSCFYENYAVDGGSALYVNDNGATDAYFDVPAGYSTSNNATELRHVSYQNGFYTNQSGYSGSILGDDGVIGGAVVYADVRGTASADDKGGNVAFIANKVFNNVTYYDKTGANQYNSVVGSGFTLRDLALSSDGDNVVAFQDNEFAGNTIGGATGVQSATEDKVDVSITNSDGNLSNYDGAIFNVSGTKFQLSQNQYPTLQNPNLGDWEGIIDNDADISVSGDIDGTSGIGLFWDIEEVNITGSAVFSSNQVHGGDIFNQISIPNPTTLSTGAEWRAGSGSNTYDNNGNWSFTDTRTSVDKNYTIEMISGGISTVVNVNVPALPSYIFNNTDVSSLESCTVTATLLTECPPSPIQDVSTDPCLTCTAPALTSSDVGLSTPVGISTLDRNVEADWLGENAFIKLESKTYGFVPTRLTTVQRDLMTAEEGMVIWNITTQCLEFYNGTQWVCSSNTRCNN